MNLETTLHALLLKFPPELAHTIGKFSIKHKFLAPGQYSTQESKIELFGFTLNNPLGLAAGFDKNGDIAEQIIDYGFAWDEVGSITYKGSNGNKKLRLFRLENQSLLNRMGLNGKPAEQIVNKLKRTKNPYAINIAKTNDKNLTDGKAIEDIVETYKLVRKHLEPTGNLIYIAFYISCPNTKDGRTFEDPKSLEELLIRINDYGKDRPHILKISPNLNEEQIKSIIEVSGDKVDGYICGNTYQATHNKYKTGGISGQALKYPVKELIKITSKLTTKPIIACGGISSGRDAQIIKTISQNVVAFQVYTSFIYAGANFAHEFNKKFFEFQKILLT